VRVIFTRLQGETREGVGDDVGIGVDEVVGVEDGVSVGDTVGVGVAVVLGVEVGFVDTVDVGANARVGEVGGL
jgi:hypothetical protein